MSFKDMNEAKEKMQTKITASVDKKAEFGKAVRDTGLTVIKNFFEKGGEQIAYVLAANKDRVVSYLKQIAPNLEYVVVEGSMNDTSPEPGKRPYIGFYKGQKCEVWATSSYEAQKAAAIVLKAKKSYDVTVMLADVSHSTQHIGEDMNESVPGTVIWAYNKKNQDEGDKTMEKDTLTKLNEWNFDKKKGSDDDKKDDGKKQTVPEISPEAEKKAREAGHATAKKVHGKEYDKDQADKHIDKVLNTHKAKHDEKDHGTIVNIVIHSFRAGSKEEKNESIDVRLAKYLGE